MDCTTGVARLAAVLPAGGACLLVDIDNSGHLSGLLGGDREMHGDCGFSAAAFLAQDCDCMHTSSIAVLPHYQQFGDLNCLIAGNS